MVLQRPMRWVVSFVDVGIPCILLYVESKNKKWKEKKKERKLVTSAEQRLERHRNKNTGMDGLTKTGRNAQSVKRQGMQG